MARAHWHRANVNPGDSISSASGSLRNHGHGGSTASLRHHLEASTATAATLQQQSSVQPAAQDDLNGSNGARRKRFVFTALFL